jgi:glycosyltransferase involved in cell wall biosynthesis
MRPVFSVIIPTYNEEKFLPNLLSSLSVQRYKNFEVIVSDGNSHDKTVTTAKSFKEKLPALTVLTHTRAGLPWQRNRGAEAATGKWLLFIDADTVFLPYALERLSQLLESETPVHHFTPWYSLDGESPNDALLTLVINATIEGSILTKRPAALGPFSGFSRESFDAINGYDETLDWGEDGDISRRAAEAGYHLTVFRETLAIYSLRRFKKQGTLKTMRVYVRNMFQVILTRKSPKSVPGYIMGGHIYTEEERKKSTSTLKKFQQKLNALAKEFF